MLNVDVLVMRLRAYIVVDLLVGFTLQLTLTLTVYAA